MHHIRSPSHYDIRWFTPEIEMDLCGHATLAAAHVIFTYYEKESNSLEFFSEFSGRLGAERIVEAEDVPASPTTTSKSLIQMKLPSRPPIMVQDFGEMPKEIIEGEIERDENIILQFDETITVKGIGKKPLEVYKSRDYVLLYESQEEVEAINPNVEILNRINLDPGGIICTAKARYCAEKEVGTFHI